MAKIRNAISILDQMIGKDIAVRHAIEEQTLNCAIAQMIYDARKEAGLTQLELARRVGTRQPVIARLEDADYEGHSLGMLQRIAHALRLDLVVELRKEPTGKRRSRRKMVV